MPRSIQLVQEVGQVPLFVKAVNQASNLAELFEIIPAAYRPRMQELANQIYRAAVKSNHTRTYLVTLEKHEMDGTFPPEIGARISEPALQISKEYSAAADYRVKKQEMDTATTAHKKAQLKKAIALKKAELAYLQSLFAEDKYKPEAREIVLEVTQVLVEDAGKMVTNPDGSSAEASWPSWIVEDYIRIKKNPEAIPARAVALAFAQIAQETAKKMKSLSLKKRIDEDVEMEDSESRTDNVDAIVQRKFDELLKKHNLQNVGGNPRKGKKTSSSKKAPQSKLPAYKVIKGNGKGKNKPQGGKGRGKK